VRVGPGKAVGCKAAGGVGRGGGQECSGGQLGVQARTGTVGSAVGLEWKGTSE